MYNLTEEQQFILNESRAIIENKQKAKINALAGCAKTTTLLEIVKHNPNKNFLYLAFNKSVQIEIEEKNRNLNLKNIQAKTQNGFILGLCRKMGFQINNGISNLSFKVLNRIFKTPYKETFVILRILEKFFISKDAIFKMEHIDKETESILYDSISVSKIKKFLLERDNGYDEYGIEEERQVRLEEKKMNCLNHAKNVWDSLNRINPEFVCHDSYMKFYQVNSPEIIKLNQYDCILMDEAQDVNPVVSSIIERIDSSLIIVGDNNQQIYEFRGAKNYITNFKTDNSFTLTKSFRIVKENAKFANIILKHIDDNNLVLEGCGTDRTDKTNAYIARTNAACLQIAFKLIDENMKFHLSGGANSTTFNAVKDIMYILENKNNTKGHNFYSYELKGIESLEQVLKEIENNVLSDEWARLFDLTDRYFHKMKKNLELIQEYSKDYYKSIGFEIITAHKSKGMEFGSVMISQDFDKFFRDKESNFAISHGKLEEKNLLYVAVTRAKHTLVFESDMMESHLTGE